MHPEELVNKYDETRREVRHLHMDIYYRPMLPINAGLDDEQVELSTKATQERFESIGFADADAAMRHVTALTAGISRAAKINRILLPAVLQWLGEGQNPDMGLLNWRKLEENFGSESGYLGFLRDSPSAAQRLCHVLSNSRFLGDALNKSVESVTWLGNDDSLQPRSRESLDIQTKATLERNAGNINDFANSIRAMRRHEIERIGLAWMSGVIDDEASLAGMTDVYDAAIEASLQWPSSIASTTYRSTKLGAIADHRRWDGTAVGNVNFSSDADVIIIYRPVEGADDDQANLFARKVQETYVRSCKVQHIRPKSNLTWILGLKAKTDRSYVPTHPARNTIDPGQAHGSIRRCYAHDMRQATRLLPRISS